MPSGSAINRREIEIEIEQIRARLVANEVERKELEAVLNDLLSRRPRKPSETHQANPVMDPTIVTTASSGAEKTALFRRLFAGRSDVFPVRWENQKMPIGGFGNLVALPLQRRAREIGNSVFIDDDLRPFEDQWAFLAARPRPPGRVRVLRGRP